MEEILIWKDKNLEEIPLQDRPDKECLILCKQSYLQRIDISCLNSIRSSECKFEVLYNNEDNEIKYLGLFWDFNDAILFAIAKLNKETEEYKKSCAKETIEKLNQDHYLLNGYPKT